METLNDHEREDECLMLRHKFQDHQYSWQALNETGWKHLYPAYKSPSGVELATAKDVMTYLDQVALPTVHSSIQDFGEHMDAPWDEHLVAKERRNVLNFLQKQHREKIIDSSSKSAKRATSTKKIKKYRNSSNAAVLKAKPLGQSATVHDPGADLFITKRTHKKPIRQVARRTIDMQAESMPTMTAAECTAFVREQCPKINDLTTREEALVREQFSKWMFLLASNHPVILYGAGSKYQLLSCFAETILREEGICLLVQGFNTNCTLESLLDLLVDQILDGEEPNRAGSHSRISSVERALKISAAVARDSSMTLQPVHLVIHSLDDIMSRENTHECADVIHALTRSAVAIASSIRVIASVDDINSVSVMDRAECVWQEAYTGRPLLNEVAQSSGRGSKHDLRLRRKKNFDSVKVARVLDVLTTVSPRHLEIVQLLARLQVDSMEVDTSQKWIDFPRLADACRDACLLPQKSMLSTYIHELKDHCIINSQRNSKGRESVTIPYSTEKLAEIMMFEKDTYV